MHFILSFCQKSTLSELAFLFMSPSKSPKYLLLGQEEAAQTEQTGKGGDACSGRPHGAQEAAWMQPPPGLRVGWTHSRVPQQPRILGGGDSLFFFSPTNIWIVLMFRRLLGLKGKKKTKLRYAAFYYIKAKCHFFVCAINTLSLFI